MLVRIVFDHFDEEGKDLGRVTSRLVECDSITVTESAHHLELNMSKGGRDAGTYIAATNMKEKVGGRLPDYKRLLVFVMEQGKTVETIRFNWER